MLRDAMPGGSDREAAPKLRRGNHRDGA